MKQRDERPVWVTPLPPLATGIAQYSADLLAAVSGLWQMGVLPEPGSGPIHQGFSRINQRDHVHDHAILQIGNSHFHERAFKLALRGGSIIVLHDVVLHHARLADFIKRGKSREYVRLMGELYGNEGSEAARDVLRGASIDIDRFPLSEDLIGHARAVIVHSQHARNRVLELAPESDVFVVPMGIPLPARVDRSECRESLGIRPDTFLVSSITHVNPMKRIPVVLRAFRRLVERHPNAHFWIAGSVAAGMNLERQIDLLGLGSHVRITGYVDDLEARRLAQASDVCVNLRYPSTGETSASLLRLMGAGVPVIVSSHGSANEVPADAALHLPVDRLEEETLAEYFAWLASSAEAASEIGESGRQFVMRHHSMGAAVDGYRQVVSAVWGLDMPPLPDPLVVEQLRQVPRKTAVSTASASAGAPSPVHEFVADAVVRLGLTTHDGTIEAIAYTLASLGIENREDGSVMADHEPGDLDPELLEILACPVCKTPVRRSDDSLKCDSCGRTYAIENGIPVMLVQD